MAKQSRGRIIVELNARQIGYEDKMTDKKLIGLLEKARAEEKAKADAKVAQAKADAKVVKAKAEVAKAQAESKDETKVMEAKVEEPLNIDYTKVKVGVSTIHDHEMRLCVIERKLGLQIGRGE